MNRPHFGISLARSAQKKFDKLDHATQARVSKAINALRIDPRPAGAIMLKGRRGFMRIRVGDYRVIYTVHDDRLVIVVVDLGHRSDIYDDI